MMLRKGLIGLACLMLAACNSEPQQIAVPREPGPNALGFYCRMTVKEHTGPKGQILPNGWTEPLWFSSVRDALTYVENEIVSDREISAFWVNDMGQGTWEKPAIGAWVEASKAIYVLDSSKSSGMGGGEAVPFKDRSSADAFIKDFGGHVADYLTARREIVEASGQPADDGGRS